MFESVAELLDRCLQKVLALFPPAAIGILGLLGMILLPSVMDELYNLWTKCVLLYVDLFVRICVALSEVKPGSGQEPRTPGTWPVMPPGTPHPEVCQHHTHDQNAPCVSDACKNEKDKLRDEIETLRQENTVLKDRLVVKEKRTSGRMVPTSVAFKHPNSKTSRLRRQFSSKQTNAKLDAVDLPPSAPAAISRAPPASDDVVTPVSPSSPASTVVITSIPPASPRPVFVAASSPAVVAPSAPSSPLAIAPISPASPAVTPAIVEAASPAVATPALFIPSATVSPVALAPDSPLSDVLPSLGEYVENDKNEDDEKEFKEKRSDKGNAEDLEVYHKDDTDDDDDDDEDEDGNGPEGGSAALQLKLAPSLAPSSASTVAPAPSPPSAPIRAPSPPPSVPVIAPALPSVDSSLGFPIPVAASSSASASDLVLALADPDCGSVPPSPAAPNSPEKRKRKSSGPHSPIRTTPAPTSKAIADAYHTPVGIPEDMEGVVREAEYVKDEDNHNDVDQMDEDEISRPPTPMDWGTYIDEDIDIYDATPSLRAVVGDEDLEMAILPEPAMDTNVTELQIAVDREVEMDSGLIQPPVAAPRLLAETPDPTTLVLAPAVQVDVSASRFSTEMCGPLIQEQAVVSVPAPVTPVAAPASRMTTPSPTRYLDETLDDFSPTLPPSPGSFGGPAFPSSPVSETSPGSFALSPSSLILSPSSLVLSPSSPVLSPSSVVLSPAFSLSPVLEDLNNEETEAQTETDAGVIVEEVKADDSEATPRAPASPIVAPSSPLASWTVPWTPTPAPRVVAMAPAPSTPAIPTRRDVTPAPPTTPASSRTVVRPPPPPGVFRRPARSANPLLAPRRKPKPQVPRTKDAPCAQLGQDGRPIRSRAPSPALEPSAPAPTTAPAPAFGGFSPSPSPAGPRLAIFPISGPMPATPTPPSRRLYPSTPAVKRTLSSAEADYSPPHIVNFQGRAIAQLPARAKKERSAADEEGRRQEAARARMAWKQRVEELERQEASRAAEEAPRARMPRVGAITEEVAPLNNSLLTVGSDELHAELRHILSPLYGILDRPTPDCPDGRTLKAYDRSELQWRALRMWRASLEQPDGTFLTRVHFEGLVNMWMEEFLDLLVRIRILIKDEEEIEAILDEWRGEVDHQGRR
ncbi:hypothetical protein CkaCkLH20_06622 [Colletotrichum karsti]|uniref:Uncharacterized protein n=1 Tax=Colletotrichum karsti TaxID=1095194 RepID=A0A9P6I4I1_9PEZI|nr:uncharacterized protein CkaCkLH20_06622 [Colletotrichum karsti]KAF9875690.1 hypothetical protein CkaCkLH20_06622 [Colletotrichum karsti]